jgi:hypothetical protein
MPALVDFPAELIGLVAAEFDTEDFFNFRLVCRELNSKSFSHFLDSYFRTRYHMLDRYSLENLLQVSSHPVFGPSLRTLVICVDHLTDEPPLFHPSTRDNPGEDGEAFVNAKAYNRYLDDQNDLRESELDMAYLTHAFINLPNCKTIVVGDTHQPWGAASQKKHTGVSPTSSIMLGESIEFVTRLFRVVFAAVIASHLALEAIDISIGFDREAISPDMLALPKLCSKLLQSRLTSLSTLLLMVNPDNGMSSRTWASGLVKFINLFPNLNRLGLTFELCDEQRRLRAISKVLRLRCLRVLKIDAVECTENDLARLFLNHKNTLKEIDLTRIWFLDGKGSWRSLTRTIREQLSIENLTIDCCEDDDE